MGTIVTIELATPAGQSPTSDAHQAIERAFEWFREVERVCNRFDPSSELRRLTATPGQPVEAGALLFAAVEFALAIAEDTGGAFDPTVGAQMERRGFNRDYRSGAAIDRSAESDAGVSYRDVRVDRESQQVTVDRPLTLDLSALAKGLAVDLAARELSPFEHFAIDAGGDLYVAGQNTAGAPWSIGVRHPRRDGEAITRLRLTDAAICTSGDYERQSPDSGHHIIDIRAHATPDIRAHATPDIRPHATPDIRAHATPDIRPHAAADPRADAPAGELASVTVIAPTAMLADALATAAFVLGPVEGLRLLERHGVEGLMYSPALDRVETAGIVEIEDRG